MSPGASGAAFGVVYWQFTLEGKVLDPQQVRVGNVEISETLDGHSTFTVECLGLPDPNESELESSQLDSMHDALGQRFEIGFGHDGEVVQTFKGTITEIEGRRSYEHGYALVLSGCGATRLIDDVPRTRPFPEMKVSDVVKYVLGDRGIQTGTVDATKDVFKLLLQQDETDYEFLRRLCRDAGLWFYYDGEKVNAVATPIGGGAVLTLGSDLHGFNLRLAMRAGRLEATSWNAAHSDQVWADTKPADGKGGHDWQIKAHAESERTFDRAGLVTPPFHPEDSSQLSNWLKARSQAWGARLLVGEGFSEALALELGGAIAVKGAGKGGGDYVIVEIVHGTMEDRQGGYRNHFRCLPKKMAKAPANPDRLGVPQVFGAKVLDNKDPDKLGRVKVVLHRSNPKGDGEDGVHWVRVSQPFAGANMGTWWLPEIDDEVVVAFLEGDSRELVCLGSLYHSKTTIVQKRVKSDVTDSEFDKNAGKLILTRSGNRILLSDAEENETIEITSPDGKNRVTLLLGGSDDDARVQIDTVGNVEITAKKQISIEAKDVITVKGEKDITIEAKGALNLKSGKDLKVDSGANLDLEAKNNVKTKGGVNVDVEGTKVGVAGKGTVEVKGAMIKLN